MGGGNHGEKLGWLGFPPVGPIGEILLWVGAAVTLIPGWDFLNAGPRHAARPLPAAPAE